MSYNILTTRSSGLLRLSPGFLQRYCSSVTKVEKLDVTSVDEKPLFEDQKFSDEEIAKMRYKSGLNPEHRNILMNKIPYEEERSWHHATVKYKRRMLGRYGLNVLNVKPGIFWPSKEQVEDAKEYERVAYPHELREAWKILADQRKAEKERILARDREIDKNMQKVGKWRKELQDKLLKKETEFMKAKERRERLIEEVRQHFGFKIDSKDERFKELMEKKEKEEAKKRKAAKKEEKLKKYLNKITDETSEDVKTNEKSSTTEVKVE